MSLERRKHPRIRVEIAATVSAGERWLRGDIVDISAGGLQLRLPEELPKSFKTGTLRLTRKEAACTATLEVAWNTRDGCGVHFVELDDGLKQLIQDLTTMRPAFHKRILSQVSEVEFEFTAEI